MNISIIKIPNGFAKFLRKLSKQVDKSIITIKNNIYYKLNVKKIEKINEIFEIELEKKIKKRKIRDNEIEILKDVLTFILCDIIRVSILDDFGIKDKTIIQINNIIKKILKVTKYYFSDMSKVNKMYKKILISQIVMSNIGVVVKKAILLFKKSWNLFENNRKLYIMLSENVE